MTLLILAGGSGSRYGGSKQFDGVGPNGEYLLEYSLYDAIISGFTNVVIVCSVGTEEAVATYFKKRLPSEITVQCIGQSMNDVPEGCSSSEARSKPWGTAHAVWSAREKISGRFVTINADDFYGRSSFGMATSTKIPVDHCGMVSFQLKNTLSENGSVSRGVCEVAGDDLLGVEEFTSISAESNGYTDEITGKAFSGDELVSMNMWMLDDSIFPLIENQFRRFLSEESEDPRAEFYLPYIVQEAITQGRKCVKVFQSQEQWMGLTFKEDRSGVSVKLLEYTKKGAYPSPLWK